MRIRLSLQTKETGPNIIPVNYAYEISSWIYHTLAKGNKNFADQLHAHGYILGTRQFKFFCFSPLQFEKGAYAIRQDRLIILSGKVSLELSFLIPNALQHFVQGLFTQEVFTLGDKISQTNFIVNSAEILPPLTITNSISLQATGPLVISKFRGNGKAAEYLRPEHSDFERIFFDNLTRKYAAAIQTGLVAPLQLSECVQEMNIKLCGPIRKKGIQIKAGSQSATHVIGYQFAFQLSAPSELIQLGYYAGFGEKNSLGFGYCKSISDAKMKSNTEYQSGTKKTRESRTENENCEMVPPVF